ncbi:HAD-IA family hydrolase [Paludisphaera rhizosphaerae]|uniref:HAD-IA family hydrolase n=1 Tax=Paludisphaera rhizosphaerae TaxID=2711216 RepID=UPI0013EAF9C2|nr:HAD-IA family hydrolase [Paludisphaera rhizosphaerae]
MSTQPNWRRIQGIVLDAVGTLIRPTPSVAAAYTDAAARQGIELNPDEVRGRFNAAFGDDLVQGADGVLSTDESVERRRWRAIVGRVLPEVPEPDRAFDELWDHFGRPESWSVFPDSVPAVEAVQEAGMRVCIGSNFDSRLHAVVAGLPELAEVVELIVVSSEVGYRKPHGAFFRAACERLGLPPERVLSVGDDLENDVLGARRAGLSALHLTRRGEHPADPANIPDLSALAILRGAEA